MDDIKKAKIILILTIINSLILLFFITLAILAFFYLRRFEKSRENPFDIISSKNKTNQEEILKKIPDFSKEDMIKTMNKMFNNKPENSGDKNKKEEKK